MFSFYILIANQFWIYFGFLENEGKVDKLTREWHIEIIEIIKITKQFKKKSKMLFQAHLPHIK